MKLKGTGRGSNPRSKIAIRNLMNPANVGQKAKEKGRCYQTAEAHQDHTLPQVTQ